MNRTAKFRQLGLSLLVVASSWILNGCASSGQQQGGAYPYPPPQQGQMPPYQFPPTPGKGPDVFTGQMPYPGQYQPPFQFPAPQPFPDPGQGLPVQVPPWIIDAPQKPYFPPPIVVTKSHKVKHHHHHHHHKHVKKHEHPKHPPVVIGHIPRPQVPRVPQVPQVLQVPQVPQEQFPFPGQTPPKGGGVPPFQFPGQLPVVTKDYRPIPNEMVYSGFKGK